MACKLKIVYQGREAIIQEKTNIDFRFLDEKLGLCLSKDKLRNPTVLSINIIDNQEISVSKNSFTTTVYVKFNDKESWKSLLVSDNFELEEKAYLLIDKFEIMIERLKSSNAGEVTSKNVTPTSEKQIKPNVRNNQKTSENTPMSTPTSNGIIKESDPLANEGSEDFWNYVDLLLSDDKEKKASVGKTEIKETGKYDKTPETRPHTTVFNLKKSPKKSDLMMEAQFSRATLEELEDDIQVSCPAVRKKVQREEVSQGSGSQKSGSQLRTSVSMPVESDSQTTKEMVVEKHPIDRLNDYDYKRIYVPPKKEKKSFENSKLNTSQEKSNMQEKLVTPERKQRNENLIIASLSQEPTRKLRESGDPLDKMEDEEQTKLLKLKQIIDDKRVETAKNSVKKSVAKMELTQEVKEPCSICLSDTIEAIGKLNSCNHMFCFECIKDWSKVTNECPLCKVRFNEIVKKKDGEVLETIKVSFKKQVYEEDYIEEDVDENCYECGNDTDMYLLLVCDSCNFYCCHTYCCRPALDHIPLGDWFCKFCEADRQGQGQRQRGGRAANRRRGNNTNANTNTTTNNNSSRNQRGSRGRTTRNSTRRTQSNIDAYFDQIESRGRESRNDFEEENSRSSNSRGAGRHFDERSLGSENSNSRNFGNSSRYTLRNQGRVLS